MISFQRRIAGAVLVAVCAVATALAMKRFQTAPPESGPAYREKGPADARITIVEFSDFQCPACRAAEEPLHQLLELYGKDARFIFKQFPLETVHRNARAAAIAAECMGRQGKFWPLHDLLYAHQEEWGELEDPRASLEKYEKQAGADMPALKACQEDPSAAAAIEADKKEGRQRWVAATPTFFVNGKRYVGGRQLAMRAPAWIDKELKK